MALTHANSLHRPATTTAAVTKSSYLIIPTSISPYHTTSTRIKPKSKPISAVKSSNPSPTTITPPPKRWTLDSWKSKTAFQLPEYPDKDVLETVIQTLESFPPVVFAGEARSLEERLGQAALGNAFLLQGGDCAESFKEFNAVNIRDTFRVLLQMGVVLMFGGQMPIIKVSHFLFSPSIFRFKSKTALIKRINCL